jgi:hypothetical protein
MSKKPIQTIQPPKKLALPERRTHQKRFITIGRLAILALIAVGIVFVIMNWNELRAQRSVAIVNGDRISLKDLQCQTRYERYTLLRSAEDLYQYAQIIGPDQSVDSTIAEMLNQIEIQLTPETVGQSALDHLIKDRLIRQEARRRRLSVTEVEIEKALRESFGFYPEGTPTPLPTRETIPTSTFSPLQQTLIPPTPVLTATEEITLPSLTLEAADSQAITPILFDEATYLNQKGKTLEALQTGYNLTEADLRRVIESFLYQRKVMETVLAEQNLDHIQEQVWARHILVADNQELLAQDLRGQLEKGADFCVLAAEFSIDIYNKDNCGDLGWFLRGQMVPEFSDAAFSLQVSEISQPVKSIYGWHLIQVLGHEKRQLSEKTYNQLRQQIFNEWLQNLREISEIEIRDDWKAEIPTEPELPPTIRLYMLQVFLSQPEMVSPPTESIRP